MKLKASEMVRSSSFLTFRMHLLVFVLLVVVVFFGLFILVGLTDVGKTAARKKCRSLQDPDSAVLQLDDENFPDAVYAANQTHFVLL